MSGNTVAVDVDGRTLRLSNLDKVLYPEVGLTKGEIITYYTTVAPVLLPHLAARALTRKRYPNGVDGPFFFEKNTPRGTPDWSARCGCRRPGSTKNRDEIDYIVVEDLATLVWLANLAALELHTPQWKVGPRGGVHGADQLVLDLDPGAPAAIGECCQVALLLREALEADGLTAVAKTSGSKGLQVYAAIARDPVGHGQRVRARAGQEAGERAAGAGGVADDEVAAAGQGAGRLEPEQRREDDRERLLAAGPADRDRLDAGRPGTRWAAAAEGAPLSFTQADVLARIADGDLFEPLLAADRPALPKS